MTVNRLMVLLDVYRNTFNRAHHPQTTVGDLVMLVHDGLIMRKDMQWKTTDKGDSVVLNMLRNVKQHAE